MMDIEEAKAYLKTVMSDRFTDKTFEHYITYMLAGDFAVEVATTIKGLDEEVTALTALCDGYRGEIERLKVDCECHRIQAVDRGNSYQKAAAEIERLTGELQAYRDEETCMCGSPIKTHTMGDGHSPVSVMDYRLGQLVEGEQGLQAALTRARAEGMEEGSRVMRIRSANVMRRFHSSIPQGEAAASVIMSLPLVTEAAD